MADASLSVSDKPKFVLRVSKRSAPEVDAKVTPPRKQVVGRSSFLRDILVPSENRHSDKLSSNKSIRITLYPAGFTLNGSALHPYDSTTRQLLRSIDLEKATPDLLDLEELLEESFVDGVLPITVIDRRSEAFPTETQHRVQLDSAFVAMDIDRLKLPEATRLAVEQKILMLLQPPLCLEADPAVVLVANTAQFNRLKMNGVHLRRRWIHPSSLYNFVPPLQPPPPTTPLPVHWAPASALGAAAVMAAAAAQQQQSQQPPTPLRTAPIPSAPITAKRTATGDRKVPVAVSPDPTASAAVAGSAASDAVMAAAASNSEKNLRVVTAAVRLARAKMAEKHKTLPPHTSFVRTQAPATVAAVTGPPPPLPAVSAPSSAATTAYGIVEQRVLRRAGTGYAIGLSVSERADSSGGFELTITRPGNVTKLPLASRAEGRLYLQSLTRALSMLDGLTLSNSSAAASAPR